MEAVTKQKYQAVIGLEVHIQLATKSKLFASDINQYGDAPNTNISVITLGHPGSLPKVNKQAIAMAVKMGLACNSAISRQMIFDRKNYFYPDLPKGYQITQDRTPICVGGDITVQVNDTERAISLNRIHLEEDAGKLMHMPDAPNSQVDFNRAGTPLIELVTEPVIHDAEEAFQLLTEVRKLVRYLEICDGNMEQGSMRCDANVSVRLHDSEKLGKKVEVKNLNSIRNVRRAIKFEINRQIDVLEAGGSIGSETRTFDEKMGSTAAIRDKETLTDYRYFPDPDLGKIVIDDRWLEQIKSEMPLLPWQLKDKFISDYQLKEYDATLLTESKALAAYFDSLCRLSSNFKANANWLIGPVRSHLNESGNSIDQFVVAPEKLNQLIAMVENKQVSFSVAAQQIFPKLIAEPHSDPLHLAKKEGVLQSNDSEALAAMVEEVLSELPEKVKAYKNGKKGLIGLFMGQLMKKTNGAIDPSLANELLRKYLD
ncbi:MAG: Asp-tRNA(Asn)/Glu-tRNA(Gln) amidotransferase subunit GatB [Cyclobacteriaceae bacterium]